MLYLRTGLPGAGKTLNAIREIDLEHQPDPNNPSVRLYKDPDNPDLPPRTIYYYGIPELKLDRLRSNWVEFETPEKWFDLPDGSVIVCDEAQQHFGNDGTRARPEKFSRFETHRHQGLDIHLITQHPSLISPHVRKLVGKHINFIRPYGREKGIFRHEYEFCIDSPEKRTYFKQAQETKVELDKDYFGVYKSSTIHTHKPIKPSYFKGMYIAIAVIVSCIAGLVLVGVAMANKFSDPDDPEIPEANVSASNANTSSLGSTLKPKEDSKVKTAEDLIGSYTPRIDSYPASAPRYDDLSKPRDIPRLQCTSSNDPRTIARFRKVDQVATINGEEIACQCYTQQGTRIKTSVQFCADAVANGIFDDTRQMTVLARPSGISNESAPLRRGPAATAAPTNMFGQPDQSITIVGSGNPGILW